MSISALHHQLQASFRAVQAGGADVQSAQRAGFRAVRLSGFRDVRFRAMSVACGGGRSATGWVMLFRTPAPGESIDPREEPA
jgi:hypothetical protein